MGTLNCICGHETLSDLTKPPMEIRCENCGRNLLDIIFESIEPVLSLPGTMVGMLDILLGMMTIEVLWKTILESNQLTDQEKAELLEKLEPNPLVLALWGQAAKKFARKRKMRKAKNG